jgi:hypothetical protein
VQDAAYGFANCDTSPQFPEPPSALASSLPSGMNGTLYTPPPKPVSVWMGGPTSLPVAGFTPTRVTPRNVLRTDWMKGITPSDRPAGSACLRPAYLPLGGKQSLALHWFRRPRIHWEVHDDIHEAFLGPLSPSIC